MPSRRRVAVVAVVESILETVESIATRAASGLTTTLTATKSRTHMRPPLSLSALPAALSHPRDRHGDGKASRGGQSACARAEGIFYGDAWRASAMDEPAEVLPVLMGAGQVRVWLIPTG